MKAQGRVRGILIEGGDGHEYLLGFGPTEQAKSPTSSRWRRDGKDFFLWMAFQEALKAFPPVPAWPTWSS
ncbi:MAG: hypothetical protein DMD96_06640 [Candidatus Rokuibacteriota bacterium]|nr:MAG: hypothetical protein DMD96_06640 [Candidatus Rokubacteria bacterium]